MKIFDRIRSAAIRCIPFICVFLLFTGCLVFTTGMTDTCHAKSWTEDADKSIYEDGKTEDGKDKEEDEEKEPGKVEKWFSEIVISLSDGINSKFESMDMSLDRIICGRVGSGSASGVALFTFELVEGNPYGTIGAVVYTSIRSITFVMIVIIAIGYLTKASWVRSGNTREQVKENLSAALVYYGVLFIMPYILDLFLYIRDTFLYNILDIQDSFFSAADGNATFSIVGHFQALANESLSITDAIMYLAAVIVTIFFAGEYAGMAMAMLVMFVMFPLVCVKGSLQKGSLTDWVWDVFSISFTPVIDMLLMSVPVLIGVLFPKQWLLKLLLCVFIIPSRNVAKSAVGMTSAGGSIANGMMSFMAIRGALSMAKRGAARIGSAKDSIDEARADRKSANYHEQMAQAEDADEKESMQNGGFKPLDSPGNGESFGVGKNSRKRKMAGILNHFGLDRSKGKHSSGDVQDAGNDENGLETQVNGGAGNDTVLSSLDDSKNTEDIRKDLTKERAELKEDTQNRKQGISALRTRKAALQKENAKLRMEEADSGGSVNHSKQIAKNNLGIAAMDEEIANTQEQIAENDSRVSKIDENLQRLGGSANSAGKGRAMSGRQMKVLQRMATVDNFETPEFENLSHADKAALYRKRARKNMVKAATSTIPVVTGAAVGASLGGVGGMLAGGALGSTGSATGAVLGAGATMFMGAPAMVMSANVGSAVGGAVSGGASAVINFAASKMAGSGLNNPKQSVRYTMSGTASGGGGGPQQTVTVVPGNGPVPSPTGGSSQVSVNIDSVAGGAAVPASMVSAIVDGTDDKASFGMPVQEIINITQELQHKVSENMPGALNIINESAHGSMQQDIQDSMRKVVVSQQFSSGENYSRKRDMVASSGAKVVADNIYKAMQSMNFDIQGQEDAVYKIIHDRVSNDPNIVAMADKLVKEYDDAYRMSMADELDLYNE